MNSNLYKITALVGSEFYHGPAIELGYSRFLWTAKLKGWIYLQFHPQREVIITR